MDDPRGVDPIKGNVALIAVGGMMAGVAVMGFIVTRQITFLLSGICSVAFIGLGYSRLKKTGEPFPELSDQDQSDGSKHRTR